jgi:hypothetical protein
MPVGSQRADPLVQVLAAAPLLADFRAAIGPGVFTPADREFVVRQAVSVIDGVYVHLWQKRAMYGVEASQRLRPLRRRLGQLTNVLIPARSVSAGQPNVGFCRVPVCGRKVCAALGSGCQMILMMAAGWSRWS